MSEPNKNIPPAFRNQWSVQPLSYAYYLILWGVPSDRIESVLKDLLPGRSMAALSSMIFKIRQYITMKKSGEDKPKWMQKGFIKRMDQVAKMPVSSNISRFREEGRGFVPTTTNRRSKTDYKAKPTTTVVPATEPSTNLESESPFKPQKLVRPLDAGEQREGEVAKTTGAAITPVSAPSIAKLASEEDHKKFVEAQRSKYTAENAKLTQEAIDVIADPSVLEEIKALVTFARGLGATEVKYKDVKIKF